ncbi:MAG TPA: tRNA threonylcarbamoyladenosine dehydratase [Ruminiclostridium sp.]|nr:tRNA threonylcarbamoyladenosine dehydratase [Ruminiclostridium sp.]
MPDEFSRTELLLGREAIDKLKSSCVAVFGIGGVGSFTAEGLVRAGIGSMILIDDDRVCLTNINRQLHATRKTIGKFKADVMRDRIMEINPKVNVEVIKQFYSQKDSELFFEGRQIDYIVDAIDTVSSKLDLVMQAKKRNIQIISCMGAGNKLDPTKFEVADIYETSVCPLAKVMRHELRQRGVDSLKVVYSKETPITPIETDQTSCKFNCVCPEGTKRKCTDRRQVPGSVSFVPSVAGLIIAGEVIKDLSK